MYVYAILSNGGPCLWKFLKKSLGELFVVKMMGSGGESMYYKTFGNKIHPEMGIL